MLPGLLFKSSACTVFKTRGALFRSPPKLSDLQLRGDVAVPKAMASGKAIG